MKYLITEQQRDLLLNTLSLGELGYGRLGSMVESLKPIEPLSNEDIERIYERIDDYYSASWTHKFASDIEAHILGEKNES